MHYWLYGEGVAFGDVVCEWSLIVSDYVSVVSRLEHWTGRQSFNSFLIILNLVSDCFHVSDYKLVTSNGPKSFRIKRLCYRNEKLCNYAKNSIVFEYYSTLVSKASPFIVI